MLPLHSILDGRCTCGRDCDRNIGKHPLTAHGKNDATTDTEQVKQWAQRWPWANWGIRPPVGVMVLDVDPRHGGDTALLDLTRQHDPLPPTLTARTGGGGSHIWLAYAGRVRGQLCRGVDIKTNSGYVVAPPSVHATGRRYEWSVCWPTAPAPRWIRRLLNPAPLPPALTIRAVKGGDGGGLVRAVATAEHGNRNNVLNWAAYRAYQRGGDPALIAEIRRAALDVGLSEKRVKKTIASAAKAVTG